MKGNTLPIFTIFLMTFDQYIKGVNELLKVKGPFCDPQLHPSIFLQKS